MLLHDLRLSLRRLLREPGFTLAAILTLALGVGANIAVFSLVEAVLLRPLPYPEADRLAVVHHRDIRTGLTKDYIGLGDYIDLTTQAHSFTVLGAYGTGQGTVYEANDPFRVSALLATSGALEALRVQPFLGRSIEADDSRPGAAPVMLLGYDLWTTRYAADSSIVGRSIKVDDELRTVIGVAPPGFRFPPNYRTDIVASLTIPVQTPAQRQNGWIRAVGRLAPGVDAGSATRELTQLSDQFRQAYPATNQAASYYAMSLRDALVGNTKPALVLLLAAVTVVLLIAAVNVANLLVARSLARKREMAVRIALGAGRGTLIRQLLTESLVLAAVAGVAGLIIARLGMRGLVSLVPASVAVPGLREVGLNLPVLGFAFGLIVVTAAAFSLLSAATVRFETAAADLVGAGRTTMSRLARRAMSGLVGAEIAFAVMLLVGAGLVLRTFATLLSVDPGFTVDRVMTLEVALPSDRYATPPAREGFYRNAFAALRARPEVTEVGAAAVVPLTGNNWTVPFERTDQPTPPGQQAPDVGWQMASGGYFRALQIPLREGRLFDERDGPAGPPAVIISEALAQRFFGQESAVGRQVKLGPQAAEIIGVVGSIRRASLTDTPRADMYMSFEHSPQMGTTLFIRTTGDPAQLLPTLQRVLREQEPAIVFGDAETMTQVAAESLRTTRLLLWLLGGFAATALLLAAVGIYAVMAYVVRQQTREIGTRMALGALEADILRMVLRQGAVLALGGILVGLGVGLAAAQALRSTLYGVSAADPVTLVFAALLLGGTTLAACYLPA
ncbi:MAG TPA: ABC transporter permease, partial [Gemmatimonadales bacterium]|nr:ABC transporter permease [Gemmatimonadales bacterium]